MSDQIPWWAALLLGIVAGSFLAGSWLQSLWQGEMIRRGLAIHCPLDGAFAFIGECAQ